MVQQYAVRAQLTITGTTSTHRGSEKQRHSWREWGDLRADGSDAGTGPKETGCETHTGCN
jgi:hypothetical protein